MRCLLNNNNSSNDFEGLSSHPSPSKPTTHPDILSQVPTRTLRHHQGCWRFYMRFNPMGGNNPAVTIIHRAKTPNRPRGDGVKAFLAYFRRPMPRYTAGNPGYDAKIQHLLLNCMCIDATRSHITRPTVAEYLKVYEYRSVKVDLYRTFSHFQVFCCWSGVWACVCVWRRCRGMISWYKSAHKG